MKTFDCTADEIRSQIDKIKCSMLDKIREDTLLYLALAFAAIKYMICYTVMVSMCCAFVTICWGGIRTRQQDLGL